MKHAVYSFWDDNKICIYVGITGNIWKRFSDHIQMSSFAWEIFDCAFLGRDLTRPEALDLETRTIEKWNPRYNDRKSSYSEITYPPISSEQARDAYDFRARFSMTGPTHVPQIIQDHGQRFQSWLEAHPGIDIREWPGATGCSWSDLIRIRRASFVQDIGEAK